MFKIKQRIMQCWGLQIATEKIQREDSLIQAIKSVNKKNQPQKIQIHMDQLHTQPFLKINGRY